MADDSIAQVPFLRDIMNQLIKFEILKPQLQSAIGQVRSVLNATRAFHLCSHGFSVAAAAPNFI